MNITVSIPDQYLADAAAFAKDLLGDQADGLTDQQAVARALHRWVESRVRGQRRRTVPSVTRAVIDAETAESAKTAAVDVARRARKTVEAAEDAAVAAAFTAS